MSSTPYLVCKGIMYTASMIKIQIICFLPNRSIKNNLIFEKFAPNIQIIFCEKKRIISEIVNIVEETCCRYKNQDRHDSILTGKKYRNITYALITLKSSIPTASTNQRFLHVSLSLFLFQYITSLQIVQVSLTLLLNSLKIMEIKSIV